MVFDELLLCRSENDLVTFSPLVGLTIVSDASPVIDALRSEQLILFAHAHLSTIGQIIGV